MSQRVVFSFDDSSLNSLKQVQEKGGFPSMASAVREAIMISEILQDQAAAGFYKVFLRNPKTDQEMLLEVPSLERLAKASRISSRD